MKFTIPSIFAVITLCTISTVSLSGAQTPSKEIIHHNFEKGAEGWTSFGASAKVSATQDAANVKLSKGSLKFDYPIAKGAFSLMVLPTPLNTLTKAQSIQFWIRPDISSSFVLYLSEKDGGRYYASFAATAGKWQQVVLSTSDFILGTDPTDPKDPNNKLDLDKVEAVSLMDLMQLLAQSPEPMVENFFQFKFGPRQILLNDFVISEAPVGNPLPAGTIDDFSRPQLSWFALRLDSMQLHSGQPLDGAGVKVEYKEEAGRLTAIARRIAPGQLKGAEAITFKAASSKKVSLIFQIELIGGAKFNHTVDLPGDSMAHVVTVPFKGIPPSIDSPDPNADFSPEEVKQIILIDVSGISGTEQGAMTLWVGKVTYGKAASGK